MPEIWCLLLWITVTAYWWILQFLWKINFLLNSDSILYTLFCTQISHNMLLPITAYISPAVNHCIISLLSRKKRVLFVLKLPFIPNPNLRGIHHCYFLAWGWGFFFFVVLRSESQYKTTLSLYSSFLSKQGTPQESQAQQGLHPKVWYWY